VGVSKINDQDWLTRRGYKLKTNKKVYAVIGSTENIDNGYADIAELSRSCRFSDCTHTTETDCAILAAIASGHLSEDRFNRYFREKNEAVYVSKQRNKTKAIDYMKQLKLFARD